MINSFPFESSLAKTIGTSIFGAGLALFAFDAPTVADDYATAAELGLMEGFPPAADKRVDRSNALFTPPFNRWSYLNMRSVYPTAGIDNADEASPLKISIDGDIDGLMVTNPETGEAVDMETYFKETYTDALVVVQGDEIVFEKYFNGMDADHPHQMMSVTKSFAGLFGLLAAAEGKLSESDPVTQYVPELDASGAFADATVGQVFDMVNAMDFSEDYADPASGIVQYGKVLGLIEAAADETAADSIYDYLVTLPKDPDHEHGDIFHYQTPKTDVVNWVTNRASGVSFQDALSERLWSRLGTDGETYVLLDKDGTLFAGGGLNATPNDLARFAIMMLNGGEFGGEQVVPATVIEDLSNGGDVDAFSNGTESKGVMGQQRLELPCAVVGPTHRRQGSVHGHRDSRPVDLLGRRPKYRDRQAVVPARIVR